jgi:hypothetical protein
MIRRSEQHAPLAHAPWRVGPAVPELAQLGRGPGARDLARGAKDHRASASPITCRRNGSRRRPRRPVWRHLHARVNGGVFTTRTH